MKRYAIPVSRELRAALKIQALANKVAKVAPKKNRAQQRAEANTVRRELKHDAQMTTAQRSRAEQHKQRNLGQIREIIARQKRAEKITSAGRPKEQRTELGIILPSTAQAGEFVLGERAARV